MRTFIYFVLSLQKLQRLNLSFNPLGDGASYPLTCCLNHMTALQGLQIESCDLTDRFLDGHVSPSLKRRKLEEIRFGFNDFSLSAIKSWMEILDFTTLKNLSLRGLSSERLVSTLCTNIQSVEQCQLMEIDLSHCNLTDCCVEQLAITFEHTPNLKKLVLKNNMQLGIDSFAELLSSLQLKNVNIEELDLLGCVLTRSNSKDSGRCVENLRSLLSWSKSLRHLRLSFSRKNGDPTWIPSLTDVWITCHERGVIAKQLTEYQLVLTTSSS